MQIRWLIIVNLLTKYCKFLITNECDKQSNISNKQLSHQSHRKVKSRFWFLKHRIYNEIKLIVLLPINCHSRAAYVTAQRHSATPDLRTSLTFPSANCRNFRTASHSNWRALNNEWNRTSTSHTPSWHGQQ